MNKLKTTFLRSHSARPSDERRSLQFARKLNAAQLTAFDDPNTPNAIPSLRPDELCEMERIAYQAWWKDLDPFSIGHLDNEAMLKFVRGCCLPQVKLEQILILFQDGKTNGLDEHQFYAMLRLIAHAQNGRTISRDMVYLGAPVPKFQTNAIDALIKSAAPTPKVSSSTCGTTGSAPWQSGTTTRNSWIQPSPSVTNTTTNTARQQQQQQRPTSWYVGQQPLPIYDPAPSAPFLSPPATATTTTTPTTNTTTTTTTNDRSPFRQDNKQYTGAGLNSWSHQPMSHSSTTISGKSTNNEQKHQYTHSRSRSVPYSVPQPTTAQSMTQETSSTSVFKFDTVAATPSKQQQRPAPLTSRVSMDADSFQRLSSAIDTGQSLLLTKKFVPPKASNNPFESAIDESPKHESSSSAAASYSPFADDLDNQSTPRAYPSEEKQQEASAPPWPSINRHPNKQNIYPPPVPSQATKPAYPKYARNIQPLALRRTQSYRSSDAPVDPFNTTDPQSTPTIIHHTTNTTSNTPPITFSHGNKLFRHRSDGSALMRR
ncbi:hypothetical protein K492DRAFT_170339 [Lichtheimia hyalospora FSU 10163]|nr:hypothetical protein K492DRAFT_170339 [Lichtheimia hyalospora FSU 10163]